MNKITGVFRTAACVSAATSIVVLLAFACSKSPGPTTDKGGGTDTESSFDKKMFSVRCLKPDNTPAANAAVRLIPAVYNPSASANSLVTAYTDSAGYYALKPAAPGNYNLDCRAGVLGAFFDSIQVADDSNDVQWGTARLDTLGRIIGVAHMDGQNDTNQLRADVFLMGTTSFGKPVIGGAFTLANVPAGRYLLVITPDLDVYGVAVRSIMVQSGATTNLDTVHLAWTGPVNTPPLAAFSVLPETSFVDSAITFNASLSSDAQDAMPYLQVRWEWEADGRWDTDWSFGKIAAHAFASSGSQTVRLLVTDSRGLLDTCARTVVVSDQPAIAVSVENLKFYCVEGTAQVTGTFSIWNAGNGTMDFTLVSDQAWLAPLPVGGSSSGEHQTVTLAIYPSALSLGTYSAKVIITAPGARLSPETVAVALKVHTAFAVVVDSLVLAPGTQALGTTFDDACLWITDDNGYMIRRVDPATGAFLQAFSQKYVIPSERSGQGLAYDATHNYLYYNTSFGGPISKIDLATGQELASVAGPIVWTHGMAYDGQHLWLNEHDGMHGVYRVHKVDPASGSILASFSVPHDTSGGVGIAYTNGHLWFTNALFKRCYKIDLARALADGNCAQALVDSFSCTTFGRMCWEPPEYLWVATGIDRLYKIRTTH